MNCSRKWDLTDDGHDRLSKNDEGDITTWQFTFYTQKNKSIGKDTVIRADEAPWWRAGRSTGLKKRRIQENKCTCTCTCRPIRKLLRISQRKILINERRYGMHQRGQKEAVVPHRYVLFRSQDNHDNIADWWRESWREFLTRKVYNYSLHRQRSKLNRTCECCPDDATSDWR